MPAPINQGFTPSFPKLLFPAMDSDEEDAGMFLFATEEQQRAHAENQNHGGDDDVSRS